MSSYNVARNVCQALDVGGGGSGGNNEAWALGDIEALVTGVENQGAGNWQDIKSDAGAALGRAMQLEPIQAMLKAPGTQRLKL
jgi:hypothetical protein